jgi:alkylated DNA repair dioxygenase AlkB
MAAQAELFEPPRVPGLSYRKGLLSVAEEKDFVRRLAGLPLQPFQFHGYLGNRRIVSFGWQYDYSVARLRDALPMPGFIEPLRTIVAAFSGVAADAFAHVLVTEYAPGAGIGWHRDKPMFQHVAALSFLAPCRLRFRRRRGGGWLRQELAVAPRSGYLLDGEARAVWEHSIPPQNDRRYSVTFRDFVPGYRPPPD